MCCAYVLCLFVMFVNVVAERKKIQTQNAGNNNKKSYLSLADLSVGFRSAFFVPNCKEKRREGVRYKQREACVTHW